MLGLQSLNHRARIDERSAAGVDDHHAFFHLRGALHIDEMKCFRRQRAMQTDDVRLGEKGLQLNRLSSGFGERGIWVKIVAENFHAEAREQPSQDAADFSGANDSYCLSLEVKAKKTVDREITVAHPVVGPVNPAVESHDEGQRELRHGVGRVSRNVGDLDSESGGMAQVHLIESRTPESDHADVLALEDIQHTRVQHVIDEGTDGGVAFSQLRGMGAELCLVEIKFMRGVDVRRDEELCVIRFGAEDCRFHVRSFKVGEHRYQGAPSTCCRCSLWMEISLGDVGAIL